MSSTSTPQALIAALAHERTVLSNLNSLCGLLAEALSADWCAVQQREEAGLRTIGGTRAHLPTDELLEGCDASFWRSTLPASGTALPGRIVVGGPPAAEPSAYALRELDLFRDLIQAVRTSAGPLPDRMSERHADVRSQFRNAIEQSLDGIFLMSRDCHVVEVNAIACRRLGYTRDELIGAHVSTFDRTVREEDVQSRHEHVDRHGFVFFEAIHKTRDGRPVPVELFSRSVELDGETYLCCVARDAGTQRTEEQARRRDIARRRYAEAQLSLQDSLLRGVVDSLPDPVYIRDLAGRYVLINPAVPGFLGCKHEEILGRTDFDLFPHDQAQRSRDADRRVMQSGEPMTIEREVEVDGQWRLYWVRKSPCIDERGSITGVVSFAQDITAYRESRVEREQIADRIRMSQKMQALGQLAGGVAHDFNNLLTAILGNTELLLSGDGLKSDGPSAEERVALEQIRDAARRAAGLTGQLLAFSRRRVGATNQQDLKQIAVSTCPLLRHLFGENIEVELRMPSDPAWVAGDAAQLEQILMNLMINAAEAMPRGGRLTVELERVTLRPVDCRDNENLSPGPHLRLIVQDTGVGMGDWVRQRIFEPFFTTRPRGRGTGLGLSTVYGTVQQLHGDIQVASEPGKGSTFTLLLPAADAPIRPPVETPRPNELVSRGERILVCEDDRLVRDVTSLALQSAGYQVHVAQHGRDALAVALANTHAIDLLVTDVIMPHMNGRDLAAELRRGRPDLRVLFVSGYPRDVLDRHGIEARGVAFLEKPFVPSVLLRRVRQILDEPVRA